MPKIFLLTVLFCTVSIFAQKVDLQNYNLYNKTAFIPSQCYTKTVDEKNNKHNPCFACHTKAKVPNYFNDEDLQESYSFPEYATKNRWTNLFKDRSDEIKKISDQEILKYIKEDNYKDKNGNIILAGKLKNLPLDWDFNKNKRWDGYIPDCNFNFDENGFDKNKNGNITGWRAFTYYPFLGTFWPTNGSFDDVIIRLPEVFRKDINGNIDLKIYNDNLEIVEKLIKQKDGDIPTSYVGLASTKNLKIAAGLYPEGTEFLHTVRYIDLDKDSVKISTRMKELRYSKKYSWSTYFQHQALAEEEYKENYDFPDRYSIYIGDIEKGISNKRGWYYQGFIEDEKGELRPQSYEETLFCIGCHSTIGVIHDSTFAFARKFENNGWKYWNQVSLKGVIDKNDEYLNYLKQNNHANEFRTNFEVYNKFFKNEKLVDKEVEKIKNDISYLLFPSQKRALELNKAYKIIVKEQSYIYGRDTHIKPLNNVYKEVEQDQSTSLEISKKY